MRLLPEIRSSIHGPAVSETNLSCWEITYLVSAFIFFFEMRKNRDRASQLFLPQNKK